MFKAIIVDDEPNIRLGLQNFINWEEQGFLIVGEAADGMEALEICLKHKPDLVVTDIKMPRMNGLELARELKHAAFLAKVLIISGYNDFTYAKEAIKYGVSNYLLKPLDKNEMIHELTIIKQDLLRGIRENEELKNYFFSKLVKGEHHNMITREDAEKYGMNLDSESFCVIVVDIDCPEESGEYFEKIYSGKHVLKGMMEEILNLTGGGCLFENSEKQLAIVFSGHKASLDNQYVLETSMNILESIKKNTNTVPTIGIGEIVSDVRSIHISYEKAIIALDRCIYSGKGKVYDYDSSGEKNINIREILKYIEEYYYEDISLKSLSNLFFINHVYLGRLFKNETGQYFNSYINKIRIEKARRLLESQSFSINEISEKVGYKYLDHFYRNFKEAYGCSPGEFRKKLNYV